MVIGHLSPTYFVETRGRRDDDIKHTPHLHLPSFSMFIVRHHSQCFIGCRRLPQKISVSCLTTVITPPVLNDSCRTSLVPILWGPVAGSCKLSWGNRRKLTASFIVILVKSTKSDNMIYSEISSLNIGKNSVGTTVSSQLLPSRSFFWLWNIHFKKQRQLSKSWQRWRVWTLVSAWKKKQNVKSF